MDNLNLAQSELNIADMFLANVCSPAWLPMADQNYVELFWRPYLGAQPFALWSALRASLWFVEEKGHWPPIGLLAEMMGQSDRYMILGRAATRTRPKQTGVLDALANQNLVNYWREPHGRQNRYAFQVRTSLPLLTPAQVKPFRAIFKRTHLAYLERLRVNVDQWRGVTAKTLIPRLLMLA